HRRGGRARGSGAPGGGDPPGWMGEWPGHRRVAPGAGPERLAGAGEGRDRAPGRAGAGALMRPPGSAMVVPRAGESPGRSAWLVLASTRVASPRSVEGGALMRTPGGAGEWIAGPERLGGAREQPGHTPRSAVGGTLMRPLGGDPASGW